MIVDTKRGSHLRRWRLVEIHRAGTSPASIDAALSTYVNRTNSGLANKSPMKECLRACTLVKYASSF